MTQVEVGQGQKRGWSVVCEPHAIQSASGWVSMIFFFENPRTPGGPTSLGLIGSAKMEMIWSRIFFA
jgi:hypothetical protein